MRNKLILLIMAFALIGFPAKAATHDYVIENQPGAAFRSDLNNVLSAIVTNNSSAAEPTTMYANMWWYDTSTSLLKRRNNANNAWIIMGLEAASTDGTFAANSDSLVPTQKAAKTYADTKIPATYLDTDTTLAANSDVKIATQKATKAYVLSKATDAGISVTDVTTNNASTSNHGFLKKLSNVATEFMNGAGNWVAVTIDSILPSQTGNSGKFLTTNGSASSWASVGGTLITTPGANNWVAPTGVNYVFVTMVGGGGGGGRENSNNGGSGGGSGAYVIRVGLPVVSGQTYVATVGAAGTGGTSGDNATAGGNSSFTYAGSGTLTVLGGGKGRLYSDASAGGASSGAYGGTISAGGTIVTTAGAGSIAGNNSNDGSGGASGPFGVGGTGNTGSAAAQVGTGYGSGGGGGGGYGTKLGANGATGMVYIEY